MQRHLPWLSPFDIAYPLAGGVLLVVALRQNVAAAIAIWLLCLFCYVIGRFVTASHR